MVYSKLKGDVNYSPSADKTKEAKTSVRFVVYKVSSLSIYAVNRDGFKMLKTAQDPNIST